VHLDSGSRTAPKYPGLHWQSVTALAPATVVRELSGQVEGKFTVMLPVALPQTPGAHWG
jgi:hypothetical protein